MSVTFVLGWTHSVSFFFFFSFSPDIKNSRDFTFKKLNLTSQSSETFFISFFFLILTTTRVLYKKATTPRKVERIKLKQPSAL